jgi:uncharacterized membrane protein YkoI
VGPAAAAALGKGREDAMHKQMVRGVLAALAGLFLLTAARAGEEKIPLDKLPKAVLDAVKQKYPGAELVSANKEEENGQVVYEVVVKDKGQKLEVEFKPDGTFVSVEKEVAAKDLPKAVADAIEAKFPKATIKHAAEETAAGDKVTYEVILVTADNQRYLLELDSKGKITEEKKLQEKKEKD